MALEVGEKYLSISLFGGQVNLAAFKNNKKEKPEQPDYTGNGVAIWIREKQAPKEEKKVKLETL